MAESTPGDGYNIAAASSVHQEEEAARGAAVPRDVLVPERVRLDEALPARPAPGLPPRPPPPLPEVLRDQEAALHGLPARRARVRGRGGRRCGSRHRHPRARTPARVKEPFSGAGPPTAGEGISGGRGFARGRTMDRVVISIGGSVLVPGDGDVDFLAQLAKLLGGLSLSHRIFAVTGGGKVSRFY